MIRIVTLLLLLVTVFPHAVAAQNLDMNSTDQSTLKSDLGKDVIYGDNAFVIQLTRDVQDPGSKEVTYRLKVLPRVDSDRVEVRWFVQGYSEKISKNDVVNLVTKSGVAQELTFTVRPRLTGRTEIRVELRNVAASADRVAAAIDQFITNQSWEIVPLTDQYRQAVTAYQIKNVVIIIVALIVTGLVIRQLIKLFQKWLNKQDRITA